MFSQIDVIIMDFKQRSIRQDRIPSVVLALNSIGLGRSANKWIPILLLLLPDTVVVGGEESDLCPNRGPQREKTCLRRFANNTD